MKLGRLLGYACLASKKWVSAPWANPTGVFNGAGTSNFNLQTSSFILGFIIVDAWKSGWSSLDSMDGYLFWISITRKLQLDNFAITVLMEFTKVRLENKKNCYVILL